MVLHSLYEPSGELKDEILAFGKGKLAGYKCPKNHDFIDDREMPRTGTGKIMHRLLRERYGE